MDDVMDLLVVRLASLVVIALAYMLFDLFNKRNIPSIFAYGTVAYGAILTVLYLQITLIALSVGVAVFIFAVGYLVYRAGVLGAGDLFELATLSLILPFQSMPFLSNVPQFGLPFIISVFIASGVAALVAVPLYYIPKAKRMYIRIAKEVPNKDIYKALAIGSVYIIFIGFLILEAGTKYLGIALLTIITLGSVAAVLFERPITMSMAKMVGHKEFEEGDIIAFNLMTKAEIARLKHKLSHFDRLITKRLINEMKKKGANVKVPVYKQAIPLAAPIFIGTVVSILFGNVILLLLPALH